MSRSMTGRGALHSLPLFLPVLVGFSFGTVAILMSLNGVADHLLGKSLPLLLGGLVLALAGVVRGIALFGNSAFTKRDGYWDSLRCLVLTIPIAFYLLDLPKIANSETRAKSRWEQPSTRTPFALVAGSLAYPAYQPETFKLTFAEIMWASTVSSRHEFYEDHIGTIRGYVDRRAERTFTLYRSEGVLGDRNTRYTEYCIVEVPEAFEIRGLFEREAIQLRGRISFRKGLYKSRHENFSTDWLPVFTLTSPQDIQECEPLGGPNDF